MGRPSVEYRCRSCEAAALRWAGRCASCGDWNSLRPVRPTGAAGGHRRGRPGTLVPLAHPAGHEPPGLGGDDGAPAPVPLSAVDPADHHPMPTGLDEVDRVLGGGLVPGSVTLVFGEPGVGKSTLLLQVLSGMAASGRPVLLVSAEEGAAHVRLRAERLGALSEPGSGPPMVVTTGDLAEAEAAIDRCRPSLVVVDSVQTIADPELRSPPGSVAQVSGCVGALAAVARQRRMALVLVGHVTKDGDLAGPRTMEHLVDSVLTLEGDRHHLLRVLRAVKHRFGPTGEVGLFEMTEQGLRDLADPGRLLLGDRRTEVPGSSVTALLEGRRPLLAEVQALTCDAAPGSAPRRHAQGVDARRLAVLLAVLDRRAGVSLSGQEVYVSMAGGLRTSEPATDLAVLLAVAASASGLVVPADVVSFGEVGLAGEVRQVAGCERRLAEAGRLGFRRAVVPASAAGGAQVAQGMRLVAVRSVTEALMAALELGA